MQALEPNECSVLFIYYSMNHKTEEDFNGKRQRLYSNTQTSSEATGHQIVLVLDAQAQ